MIEVLAAGPACSLQDLGRPGWAHLGVGRSGAADPRSARLANRLTGNGEELAVLECTLGGLDILIHDAAVVATAGAACSFNVDAGPPMAHQHPVALPVGARVRLAAPAAGLRTYVAVRGGFDVPAVMGSRSTDSLSGLGPPQVQAGMRLAVGSDPATAVPTVGAPAVAPPTGAVRLWPGPRQDWFDEAALERLVSSPYTVQPDSNRIGVRLAGPAITRTVQRELASEGIVTGAIQVPADGQPVVMLADHGTIGGYPVVAVVDPDDLGRIAQARPGDIMTFRWHSRGIGWP